ncbi:MAG: DUF202 domain-containing protein, partial [Desulfotomaculales bacterium]
MPAAPPPMTTNRGAFLMVATSFVQSHYGNDYGAGGGSPAGPGNFPHVPPGGAGFGGPRSKEKVIMGERGCGKTRNGKEGSRHVRDHLANERTFLSWVRTS